MSVTSVLNEGRERSLARYRTGNIFADLHLVFDLRDAYEDDKLQKLSEEYQKKWEEYAKQHKLNMDAIDLQTQKIKRIYVLRLMYDDIDFQKVKAQLNGEIEKATSDLATVKAQTGSALSEAVSELLLGAATTDAQKNTRKNLLILGVVSLGFIVLLIAIAKSE